MFSKVRVRKIVKQKKKLKKRRPITLHHAASCGNLDKLRQLLKKGADVNAKDISGDTALHIAVEYAEFDCAQLLILEGADVNIKRRDDATALHVAAGLDLDEFIPLLVRNGANVNSRGRDALTPLHCAVNESNPECVKLLLNLGASVNATLKADRTALHIAVPKCEDCIELLMERNANIFAKDVFGITPFEMAAELGEDLFKLLLSKISNPSSSDGTTPLHIASGCVNSACLQYLINNGCEVNIENDEGNTPLHFVCMAGYCPKNKVRAQIYLEHARNIEFLVRAGANVQKKNKFGFAPVHLSAKFDRLLSLMYLHQFGADLNLRGGDKDSTPLHFASQEGNLKCIKFLINNNVDKMAVDADGCTALMLAAKNSHFSCVKFLLELDVPLWATEKK